MLQVSVVKFIFDDSERFREFTTMEWLEGIERKFGRIGKISSVAAILLAVIIVS